MIYFNVKVVGPSPSGFALSMPLANPALARDLTRFAGEHNRSISLRGLDRNGRPLRPWRERDGRSDYHGMKYERWTNRTTLVPFGGRSRRIDDNTTTLDRSGVRSDGSGLLSVANGWTNRSRSLPLKWKQDGRDVLGLDPVGLRGFQAILRRYTPHVTFTARSPLSQAGHAPWRPLGSGEPLGENTPLI